jgi:dinuclear metal center YbgI/SA1388 family protein
MTTVGEVTAWLEKFAPARLAEPWDNVGLIWGDPAAAVERVMTCLTVTPTTAAEAISERAELIVSHHPILFREVKKIRADWPDTGYLWKLARSGIAVASVHTAFDNTENGINDLLCARLKLLDVAPLRPAPGVLERQATGPPRSFKVVVFTPETEREAVSAAAFRAGAGRIGAYEECSFAIQGEGTFFGTETTNPTVGERGQRETVRELRLEFICPSRMLAAVLAAVRASHSYEEPAIDVYPLHELDLPPALPSGAGRIGRLGETRSLAELAREVGHALAVPMVGAAGNLDQRVACVAIACGAGDDFLKDAARAGADALVTGEARFHRGLEAEALGLGLVVAGHFATERPGVELLAGQLGGAFRGLIVWPSRLERDAFRMVGVSRGPA